MVYEIINVRLSRSNPSVQWGFKLQQVNKNQLNVVSVEPDSLADKAGIKKSDQVREFFDNALANGMPWAQIAQELQTCNEISMVLKRCVTEPLNLPWALSEGKDSQVIVDHWDKDGRVIGHSDQNTKGYVHSFKTEHLDGPSIRHSAAEFNSSPYSSTQVPKYDLPFTKSSQGQRNSTWDRDYGADNPTMPLQQNQHMNRSQNAYSGENYVLREGSLPAGHPIITNIPSKIHPQTQQYNTSYNTPSQTAQNQQHANHIINSSYHSSRSTNTNPNQSLNTVSYQNNNESYAQSTPSDNLLQVDCSRQIDTRQWYGESQYNSSPQPNNHYNQRMVESGRRYGRNTAAGRITNLNSNGPRSQSAAPYSGPRVYYQRNSPRTYQELSPEATVQHLQYRSSPVKMYPGYGHQTANSIMGVEDRFLHPADVYDSHSRSADYANKP